VLEKYKAVFKGEIVGNNIEAGIYKVRVWENDYSVELEEDNIIDVKYGDLTLVQNSRRIEAENSPIKLGLFKKIN
jgi:hypothetical protein